MHCSNNIIMIMRVVVFEIAMCKQQDTYAHSRSQSLSLFLSMCFSLSSTITNQLGENSGFGFIRYYISLFTFFMFNFQSLNSFQFYCSPPLIVHCRLRRLRRRRGLTRSTPQVHVCVTSNFLFAIRICSLSTYIYISTDTLSHGPIHARYCRSLAYFRLVHSLFNKPNDRSKR